MLANSQPTKGDMSKYSEYRTDAARLGRVLAVLESPHIKCETIALNEQFTYRMRVVKDGDSINVWTERLINGEWHALSDTKAHQPKAA